MQYIIQNMTSEFRAKYEFRVFNCSAELEEVKHANYEYSILGTLEELKWEKNY